MVIKRAVARHPATSFEVNILYHLSSLSRHFLIGPLGHNLVTGFILLGYHVPGYLSLCYVFVLLHCQLGLSTMPGVRRNKARGVSNKFSCDNELQLHPSCLEEETRTFAVWTRNTTKPSYGISIFRIRLDHEYLHSCSLRMSRVADVTDPRHRASNFAIQCGLGLLSIVDVIGASRQIIPPCKSVE